MNVIVERVVDGDTVIVREGDSRLRVRLAYIDAPEIKQPYGKEAKEYLEMLVADACGPEDRCLDRRPFAAKLFVEGKDQYNRVVGRLWTEKRGALDLAMLSAGFAWVYEKYAKPPKISQAFSQGLRRRQEEARTQKVGLWSVSEHEPPWEWRRRHRYNRSTACDTCNNKISEYINTQTLQQVCNSCHGGLQESSSV